MAHDHVCPWWLAYTFDNPLRRLVHKPEVIFHGLVREGMTVMDAGCGLGYFSVALAGLVGGSGLVIAVDLQQQMLARMLKRAARAGVADRIKAHLCQPHSLGVEARLDFILAFWMVHETPNPADFFQQTAALLKPAGRLLLVEPAFHVSGNDFQQIVAAAVAAGLEQTGLPRVAFSRAALFSGNPAFAS